MTARRCSTGGVTLTGVPLVRWLRLEREDGSLAGRYLFVGDELVGFRWSEKAPFARRVSSDEHRGLLAERHTED